MLTLLTALGSIALFILTLPVKSVKFLKKAKDVSKKVKGEDTKGGTLGKHDTALSRIKEKREQKKSGLKNKGVQVTKKALKVTVTACIAFLRTVLMFIATLSSVMTLPILIVVIISLAVIGGISSAVSGTDGAGISHVYEGSSSTDDISTEKKKNNYVAGNWNVNQSASTLQILAMDTDEIWAYISEGRYSTKAEARSDAVANFNDCKEYWESLYYTTEVPVWVWGNKEKTEIVSSTKKITCNRNLVVFWTDFFTDLYNCTDQYVMEDIQGPNWRWVSGKDGEAVSMHSYGIAFDINPATSYTGDSFLPMGLNSKPYSAPDKLPYDQWRHTVCTFSSSWLEVAKEYNLSWGGTWQSRYDNMHFSMPGGDTDKDKTVYVNQRGQYADGGG